MTRLGATVAALTVTAALASTPRAPATGPGCPKQLLPLGADPVTAAVAAALTQDARRNRPQVTGATVAADDPSRGDQVKRDCGARAWQRTVIVYVTDRAFLPSASLSERVFFVGRTPTGYRVWQVAH